MAFNVSSLRYRITLTIFLLEVSLLFVLLSSTLTQMNNTVRENTRTHQTLILEQVSLSASVALFSSQFDLLQQQLTMLNQNLAIDAASIHQNDKIVVAHSDFARVGLVATSIPPVENHVITSQDIPHLGGIQLRFNNEPQRQQLSDMRQFMLSLALIGLFITLSTSLFFGRLLSKRLNRLNTAVIKYQQNPTRQIDPDLLQGHDEVSSLSVSFHQLMSTLQRHLRALNEDKSIVETRVIERTAELEDAHRKLIKAKQVAEQALAVKSEFLAKMSHEVRTPLNAIIGLIDLCLEQQHAVPEKTRHYLKHIEHSSHLLLDILNNILDFSKIEAGMVQIEQQPFVSRDLSDNLHFLFTAAAEKKGLKLRIEQAPDLPEILVGDLLRIKQILTNLMSNAIKFTHNGSVNCRISFHHNSHTQITLNCEVEDSGIGIADAALDSLFSDFQQGDNSISRQFGGTGLGLSIAHHLTQLMHGSLTVKSALTKGSRFKLQLPLAISQPAEANKEISPPPTTTEHFSHWHVLLVEDDAINQMIAQTMLEDLHITVALAENGQQAVDLTHDTQFDLILMDIQMPIMDGITAARHIRQYYSAQEVPIVAMTAQAMANDKNECLQAGMNDYLSKPVRKKELLTLLHTLPKLR